MLVVVVINAAVSVGIQNVHQALNISYIVQFTGYILHQPSAGSTQSC
jgi:hypothetical protein